MLSVITGEQPTSWNMDTISTNWLISAVAADWSRWIRHCPDVAAGFNHKSDNTPYLRCVTAPDKPDSH